MAAAAEGGGGPAADESGGPVWRGQLALPGMAPFGAEALAPEGRELWDVVPAAVQHIGRTEGVALNRCPSPQPDAHTPAHPAARDASHLQGLSNKRQKWTVVVAQFRGVDAAARGAAPTPPRFLRPWLVLWQSVLWLAAEACASWCSDEKSKKVVAAECGNGSRLFLVSPLALPREIVPTAWVEGELPLAADSLLGVLARRLVPAAAKDKAADGGAAAAAAVAGGKRARDGADQGVEERKPKQRRKKRKSAQQQVLPLNTTLRLDDEGLRALLAERFSNLEELTFEDGRPTLSNIPVGGAIEIFWEVCAPRPPGLAGPQPPFGALIAGCAARAGRSLVRRGGKEEDSARHTLLLPADGRAGVHLETEAAGLHETRGRDFFSFC